MYILHPDFLKKWILSHLNKSDSQSSAQLQWKDHTHRAVFYNRPTTRMNKLQTLLIKRAVPTYYNISIVTPTLRMNHILHNRPTSISMKAIQCSTTQYSVRLLYILFCRAALIDSPPNCHWPSLEVTFAQSGHSPTQDILYYPRWHLSDNLP